MCASGAAGSVLRAEPDGQGDALAAAGCRPTLVDTASVKLASRPKLTALAMAESGEQLVVTKLERPVAPWNT